MIDFKALATPFDPAVVSWRVGSTTQDKTRGLPLAYIDARDVMDRLDEVVGPQNWQCRYSQSNDERTICELAIRVDGEWVWKADGAENTDFEGVKGGLSDSFKRAAVRWGVGRYLYGLGSPWVQLEGQGKAVKIAASEMPRLRALLPTPDGKPVAVETREEIGPDLRLVQTVAVPPNLKKFTRGVNGSTYWKLTDIKQAVRDISHDLQGITDPDELVGFRKDNADAIEAMRLALPEWHRKFEESFNKRGADIKARSFDRIAAG